jgi:hypothetical protein
VDENGVSGHSGDSIADSVVMNVEIPGDLPDTDTAIDLGVDISHLQCFLGIVINGESLTGEGHSAGFAAEPGDAAEGFGAVSTEKSVPVCGLGVVIVRTPGVGTVDGDEHS